MTGKKDDKTVQSPTIDRREVLKRGALLGSALMIGNGIQAATARPQPLRKVKAGTMRFRGVNYDTGTAYDVYEGPLSRTVWRPDLLQRDLRAIREGLNCNVVTLYGTDIARLVEAADVALDLGLEVWLQPRLMGASERERLEHLAEGAEAAETLRQRGSVTLNIGVELSLFMAGIIPGKTFYEKAATLGRAEPRDIATYAQKLNAHLERAATLARNVFGGPLTYSAGEWERISWEPFDIVGLSFYRSANNEARYAETLREIRMQEQKPVVITEFGCATFVGAGDAGGTGWDIVDYSKAVPEIKTGYARSEREQADYLAELLGIYEAERLSGAFIYEFSTPASPYSPNATYDLDTASYGLVKPLLGENEREATRWEPKEAFGRIGEIYGRLEEERL